MDRLRQVDRAIEAVRSLLPPVTRTLAGPAIDDLLAQDRRTAQWLQRKIDRLHQFDQATSTLYGGDKVGGHGDAELIKFDKYSDTDDNPIDWKQVETGLENDPLTPGEVHQGEIGDCWLLSTINSLMETEDGRKWLRDGIRWDPSINGYRVRIYDNDGKPRYVPVVQVAGNGVTNGKKKQCIASLYEAAIWNFYGPGALNGNHPGSASWALTRTNAKETQHGTASLFGLPIIVPVPGHEISVDATNNIARDGKVSVGGTKKRYTNKDGFVNNYGEVSVTAYRNAGQPSAGKISLVPSHAYEVVDARDGMICLRNPWGRNYWNSKADGGEVDDTHGGLFWITNSDFDRLFNNESADKPSIHQH